MNRLETERPKHFWETDPFLRTVFGNDNALDMVLGSVDRRRPAFGSIDVDSIVEEGPVVRALKRQCVKPVPLHAKVLKFVSSHDTETKRQSLFSDWATIIAIDVHSFAIGSMLRTEGVTRRGILDAVASCLAVKVTGTIHKRYCAMQKFVKWAVEHGREVFPLKENVAYAYLVDLREDPKSAITSGQSFLEAIHFCDAMLGMQHNLSEVGDQRVKGVAQELAQSGPPMKQAEPLMVDQVKRLEGLVCSAESPADTLVLPGLLIMLYGCARHSDVQRARTMIWDVYEGELDATSLETQGYLELQVLAHKTARCTKMKRTYLPVVCPLFSLSSEPWFVAWKVARDAMDLGSDGPVAFPVLCRFDDEGRAVKQEMTSAEVGAVLREALGVTQDSGVRKKVNSSQHGS